MRWDHSTHRSATCSARTTLATSLFAVASLLAADDLAQGRSEGPRLLLAGAVLQTGLLLLFHGSPGQVVGVQVGVMAVLGAVLGQRAVRAHRAHRSHLVGGHGARLPHVGPGRPMTVS